MVSKTLVDEVEGIVADAYVSDICWESIIYRGRKQRIGRHFHLSVEMYLLELYGLAPGEVHAIVALLSSCVPWRILFSDSTSP